MKAVLYHYVREYNPKFPNFRYLNFDHFKKQLDFFGEEYGFVTFSEWESFVKTGQMPKGDKVILTFDDALSCHYEYVYPELIRRNLWGIFYVATQPYMTGKMLEVHRINLLCGAFDGQVLYKLCRALVTDDMMPFSKRAGFEELTYSTFENYEGISQFKRILNYFISPEFREEIVDKIAIELGFCAFDSNFYVHPMHLKSMSDSGMIIGSHTVSHPVMSTLSFEDQRMEVVNSFDFLGTLVELTHRTYCHPYGGFHSFDSSTIEILENLNVEYSFNVESRNIDKADREFNRYALPRYDCNEFRYGKAS